MPWQFRVTDGADQGRIFPLPESGVYPLGSSRRHAEIVLNDLYVARIHAEVEMDGSRVVLTAHDSPGGTLVNGQKIISQEIRHGDVVRMGNSHLRLEDVDTAAQEAAAEEELPTFEVEEVPEEAAAPAEEAEVVVAPAEEGEAAAATAVGDVAVAEDKAHPLPANRLRELVGHALAHFQIEGEIGMGHCSMLFRALDFKKDKTVALKVLPPDFPHSDEEMQRYVEVWKTVLPLRHANLVSLYAVGKNGPFCWLAMKYIETTSLPHIIQRLAQVEKIDWHGAYRVALHIARRWRLSTGRTWCTATSPPGTCSGEPAIRSRFWRTSVSPRRFRAATCAISRCARSSRPTCPTFRPSRPSRTPTSTGLVTSIAWAWWFMPCSRGVIRSRRRRRPS